MLTRKMVLRTFLFGRVALRMMKATIFIFLIYIGLISQSLFALSEVANINSQQSILTVGKIELFGLKRTSSEFVRQELFFEEGEKISSDAIDFALRRLRNSNLFLSVDLQPEPGLGDVTNLRFIFREKWTLTPVLRGGTGGGVNYFVVGMYDLNLLGRGIEAGLQYEQFARAPGVNMWWRQPHFFDPFFRISVEVQAGQRPLFYLEPGTHVYRTPFVKNTRFSLLGQRQWSFLDVGLGAEYVDREFDDSTVPPLDLYSHFRQSRVTGINSRVFARFNAQNLYDYLWEGHRVELSASRLFATSSREQENVQGFSLNGTHFWRIAASHNVGLRLQLQHTSGSSLLSLIRLGSLDAVRGLDDGERIGQWAWAANVEERWVSYVDENVVWQTVVFSDVGNAGKSLEDRNFPVAASLGAGIRLGFRPIARLRLRADYAHALAGLRHKKSWIVGMQHYF